VYEAADGKRFDTSEEAADYDRLLKLQPLLHFNAPGDILYLLGEDSEEGRKLRVAVVTADNVVQQVRRRLGEVTPRPRLAGNG
jgi:hypothetical protein